MLTVYKYSLPIEGGSFDLLLPRHATILSFQALYDRPWICALVDPAETENEEREFRLAGSGDLIADRGVDLHYIGTCQTHMGKLVWHLFEVIPLLSRDA